MMKKLIRVLGLAALLVAGSAAISVGLPSCGSTQSASGGLADEAYIVLTSPKVYKGDKLIVRVDNQFEQSLKVVSPDKGVYAKYRMVVPPGKRTVSIYERNGRQIYQKVVFLSSRSTRTIELP